MGLRLQLSTERVSVAPGEQTPVEITVVNTGRSPVDADVRIVGGSTGPAQRLRVPPGAAETVTVGAGLPVGYPAGEHALAVEATIVGGPDDGATTIVDLTVAVGDTARLSARLDPRHVGTRGRFRIAFQNNGDLPVRVDLSQVGSDRHVDIRFDADSIEIPPGAQRSVRAKAKMGRRVMGDENRRAFTILAQHESTPLYLTGVCSRVAAVGGGIMRLVAILAVFSVWAATLVWGVDEIRSRIGDDVDSDRATMVEEELRRGEAGGDDAEGEGEGEGTGADGEAADGETDDGAVRGARVGGTISGAQPDGVAISLRPLDPEDPQSTTDGGVLVGLRGPMAKLAGLRVSLPAIQTPESTSSREGGLWAFADVPGPGFYRVEFRKLGYETKVFVVEITEELEPVVLDTSLEAGPGLVRGTVTSDGTALGGVTVTVSDGLTTATTRTPQAGDGIGTFSFPGLSTPGTYTVTVEHDGYGTEVRRVELGPAGSADLSIPLTDGVGSIRGVVTAAPFGSPPGTTGDGLEGVTVTVVSDDLERTTTSAGGGESLGGVEIATDGSFFLPQLPLDRSYTVTFSAPGHLTQSQVTALTEEHPNAELSATLRPAVGRVQGTVQAIPIWSEQNASDNPGTANVVGEPTIGAALQPVAGVGLTLSNETNTFKTVSSDGSPNINISGIPPGSYVLTLELFNHTPARQLVEVVAGVVSPVTGDGSPVTLAYEPRGLPATASVSGQVTNLTTNRPMSAPFIIEVDGVPVTDDAGSIRIFHSTEGTFSLTGLTPGVRRLTFADVESDTDPTRKGLFEVVTVPVRLAEGQEVVGLRVLIRELPDVSGKVTDSQNNAEIANAEICILRDNPLLTGGRLPAPDDPVWTLCTTVQSRNDGTFEVEDLSPGLHFLRILRDGYVPFTTTLFVTFGAEESVYPLDRLPALRLTVQQLSSGPFPTVQTVTAGDLALSSPGAEPSQWLAVKTAPDQLDDLVDDVPTEHLEWTGPDELTAARLDATALEGKGTLLTYLPRAGTYNITVADPDGADTRTRTVTVFVAVNEVRDVTVTLLGATDTGGRLTYDFPRFSDLAAGITDVSSRGIGGIGVSATGTVDIPPSVDVLPTSTTSTQPRTTTGTLTGTTATGATPDDPDAGQYLLGPSKFVGDTASFTLNDNGTDQLDDYGPLGTFTPAVPGVVDMTLTPLDDGTATTSVLAANVGELAADMWDAIHAGGTAVGVDMNTGTNPATISVLRDGGGGLPVGEYGIGFVDPDERYLLPQPASLTVLPGDQPAATPLELTRTVSIVVEPVGGWFELPADSKDPLLTATLLAPTQNGCNDATQEITPPRTLLVDHDDDVATPDRLEYTGLPSGAYCVRVVRTFSTTGEAPDDKPITESWLVATGLLQQQVGVTVNGFPYTRLLTPVFPPAADIGGTVTARLGTVDGTLLTEAVAAMPISVETAHMIPNYTETTITSGERSSTVVVEDEDGTTLRPFGEADGDHGAYQLPPLPILAEDPLSLFPRSFTVRADLLAYNSTDPSPNGAYGPTFLSSRELPVPDGDDLSQSDVDFSPVDLQVDAVPASLTVITTSDAGGKVPATSTLSPVGTALVHSGAPNLADVVLNTTPEDSVTSDALVPIVYKLTVSADHHSPVVKYVFIPPGQSQTLEITLPAIRRFVTGQVTWNDGAGNTGAPVDKPTITVYYAGTTDTVKLPDGSPLTTAGNGAGLFKILVADGQEVPAVPAGIPIEFKAEHADFETGTSGSITIHETDDLGLITIEMTPKATDHGIQVNHHDERATDATAVGENVSVAVAALTNNPHTLTATSAMTSETGVATFSLRPGGYRFTIGAEVDDGDSDYLATTIDATLRLDGKWKVGDTVVDSLTMVRNRKAWVRLTATWDDTVDPLVPEDIGTVTEALVTGADPVTTGTPTTVETVATTVAGQVRIFVLDLTSTADARHITLTGSEFSTATVTVTGDSSTPAPRTPLTATPATLALTKHQGEVVLVLCEKPTAADEPTVVADDTVTITWDGPDNNNVVLNPTPTPATDGLERTYSLFYGTYDFEVDGPGNKNDNAGPQNVVVDATAKTFVINFAKNNSSDCTVPVVADPEAGG